jgi:hypothetical protein
MTITLNGTTGISNDGGYIGDGIVFADTTPANTLVTTTGGNVGIGTNTPNSVGGFANLTLNNSSGGLYDINVAGTLTGRYYATSASTFIGSVTSIPLVFNTGGSERARIDSSGNLLVGTTSANPVSARVNGLAVSSGGSLRARAISGDSYFGLNVTSGVNLYFYTDNGSAFVTGGNIATNGATTAYNATSDYRLKNNVQPLTSALSRVSQLRPVTWTWKEGYGGTQPNCEGFIAHELHEILPIAVTGEKDAVDADGNPVYQGIDTSFLVATLTAAIQELKAIVDAQGAEIAALKGTPNV